MLPAWPVTETPSFGCGVKAFPHLLHSWRFSTLWNLCCSRRYDFGVKSLPHSVHLAGLAWVWTWCRVSGCSGLKILVRGLLSRTFSPVCVFLQLALEELWVKSSPDPRVSSGCFEILLWFWLTSRIGFNLCAHEPCLGGLFSEETRWGLIRMIFPGSLYSWSLSVFCFFLSRRAPWCEGLFWFSWSLFLWSASSHSSSKMEHQEPSLVTSPTISLWDEAFSENSCCRVSTPSSPSRRRKRGTDTVNS